MVSFLLCALLITSVEAWTNLAGGKPTIGSSNAFKAVDGNTNTSLSSGSCSSTLVDPNASWEVDLGHHYTIYRVKITSSSDGSQLTNVKVMIRSADGTLVTFGQQTVNPLPPGEVLDFWQYEGVKGRYVSIERSISIASKLVLCEVEVYGALEQHFQKDVKRGALTLLLGHTSRSEMECAVICLWEEVCRSFVWNSATRHCGVYGDLPTVTSSPDGSVGFVSV